LIESDIITGTVARLSFKATREMWVVIYGISKAQSLQEVADKLRTNERVIIFQIASGNIVYVHAGVRDANELANLVSFVQKEAALTDVTVGMVPTPPSNDEVALSALDVRIITALRYDARRSVAELAEELGTTAKTVRRRMDRMEKEDLVSYSIHWRPDTLGDVITQIHLGLKEGAEREKVALLLVKKYQHGIIRLYNFSNLPGQIIITYWTRNAREMQDVCTELEKEEYFTSVVPNVLRMVHYYDEHTDSRLKEIGKKAAKVR
jgi:DNA-binding Lrp family transcriptional regulator